MKEKPCFCCIYISFGRQIPFAYLSVMRNSQILVSCSTGASNYKRENIWNHASSIRSLTLFTTVSNVDDCSGFYNFERSILCVHTSLLPDKYDISLLFPTKSWETCLFIVNMTYFSRSVLYSFFLEINHIFCSIEKDLII